jgi:hypothetical protein
VELRPVSDPSDGYQTWRCWTCGGAGEAPYPAGGWKRHNQTWRHRRAVAIFALHEIRKHLGFLVDALVGR